MRSLTTVRAEARYPWHWLAVFGGGMYALIYLLFLRTIVPTFAPSEPRAALEGEQNYLLVRMPNVAPTDLLAGQRIESWLVAITNNGYRPFLLSEIHRRIVKGEGLPDKTMVLLFDPATRFTFRTVGPLLAKHRFPAVWVSNPQKVKEGDRYFLDAHTLNDMRASKCWDIAHTEDGTRLVLEPANGNPIVIGKSERLHVSLSWTARQFIELLQAGQPVRDTCFLTMKRIQNHNTGLAMPLDAQEDPRFALKASLDGRTGSVGWLGTKGLRDMRVDVEAAGVTGELWVLFRNDDDRGDFVGASVGNGNATITENKERVARRLAWARVPSVRQSGNFSASITIKGRTILVSVDGKTVAHTRHLSVKGSHEAITRLMVYDKIQGAAQVRSVKLIVTPLRGKNSWPENYEK